ncbi:prepilin-type N- cleavage/methylation domain-containing protein [Salmonella enterica subsp. enterica]|uniref:Prepilin-type N- cleavage/methylation domain-containing protein n=1 Tax=Salmonella enterica I TaxID=59201 RepID=A0A379WBS2_SALET|nr:prepilin-type N- cleavage/methylation domain-containing protein [Salmonella enterica subsp. enterica]
MSRTTKIASGYGGQWSENSGNYSNITDGGLLAYRVGYNSSMYSVYLRRDGTLPMTGDLNLGGKSIKNIQDITASGTTTTGALNTTGKASVASDLAVGGTSTLNGQVNINNNLKVKSDTYLNTLSTTGWLSLVVVSRPMDSIPTIYHLVGLEVFALMICMRLELLGLEQGKQLMLILTARVIFLRQVILLLER